MSAENSLDLSWYARLNPEEREAAFEASSQRSQKVLIGFTDHWYDPRKLLAVHKAPKAGYKNEEIRRYYWRPAREKGRFERAGYIFFSIGDATQATGNKEWSDLEIGKEGESDRDLQIYQSVNLHLYFGHTDKIGFRDFQFDAYLDAALNGLFYRVCYLRNRIIHFSVMKRENPQEELIYLLDSGSHSIDIEYVLGDGEIPVGIQREIYKAVVDGEANSVSIQKRRTNPPERLLEFPLCIDKDQIAESLAPRERFADPFETPPSKDISWMGADLLAKFGVKIHGPNNYKEGNTKIW